MPPTRILILSDGRPGHFNLAEGIAAAIERIRPAAQTVRCDVRRGRWPGAVLAALTRSRLPPAAMLSRIYGIDEAQLPPCDTIVSAGAETLAASIWLSRARRVPNVFYGSLRLFDPLDFTLVLTSYARNAARPRHALFLKPSRLDPDLVPPRVHVTTPRALALLIGGDAGPIRYSSEDWRSLLDLTRAVARDGTTRWHIANSRRTPDHVSDALAAEASLPGSSIAQFLDVRTAGAGTLPHLLAQCSAVLCTADSSSMISECVWARRPTLAVAPAMCPFTADEAEYRNWLATSGWCAQVTISSVTQASLDRELAALRPLAHNPQQQLADLLERHLP